MAAGRIHRTERDEHATSFKLTPIEYTGDFGSLIDEVLTSAEQMPKEPNPGLKQLVNQEWRQGLLQLRGQLFSTVCGDDPDGLKATADHIWPRALGGDTIQQNLLPACPSCNSAKGNIAAWQMAWIPEPVVFADVDEAQGLRSLQREVKTALHIPVRQ